MCSIGGEKVDVITFVDQLFLKAIANRASDIHVEPQRDGLYIRQRIDGYLVETDQLPLSAAQSIISRLKVMGQLDIGERRLPQDGAMAVHVDGQEYEVRMATMPVCYGEKIVLRILPCKLATSNLAELGMGKTEITRTIQLLRRTGLLIVTGPTGAGKTTTLYTLLSMLDHKKRNIMTLEDPIEIQFAGINQVQIHPKIGFSFAKGLRAMLRQDPDIIMIGEIRDRETAEIAIEAALTGHLVLTSLHTIDGAGAVTRLIDMDIPTYFIASALSGVIAQRLLRLVCNHCQGTGCSHCQVTGYYDRTGIFEVLAIDELTQSFLMQQPTVSMMRNHFRERGFVLLEEALQQKYLTKITTQAEIDRLAQEVTVRGALERGSTSSV
jgi:type II secretory ATPase GspE/PulE/Tfp pilus assembly ATPase PilB-like protein